MKPQVWQSWIGQKIARCESSGDATVIILESGTAIKIWSTDILYFTVKNTEGDLWPREQLAV